MATFPDSLHVLEEKHRIRIEYLAETASTNLVASDRKYRHGDIVIAGSQTAGRGQRGNAWSSAPEMNLTFSAVLEPGRLPAEMQFYLSEIVSLSVAETLSEYGIGAKVKWPNDIYAGEKKIAGILIENYIMGPLIKRSVAGVGLNVNQSAFDPSLPNPTSVFLQTGETAELTEALDVFLGKLYGWFSKLEAGDLNGIGSAYRSRLYRKEGEYLFSLPGGGIFKASIVEIMPAGELVLRMDDGETKPFLFKEVEFVL